MEKDDRIQKIKKILLEIGAGNFHHRIERSGKNDVIEALVSLLNMTAEELEEAWIHQRFINSMGSLKPTIAIQFLIDVSGTIVAFAGNIEEMFDEGVDQYIGNPFLNILSDTSKASWLERWEIIQRSPYDEVNILLSYKPSTGLLIAGDTQVIGLKAGDSFKYYTVTVVKHVKKQVVLEPALRYNANPGTTPGELDSENKVDQGSGVKKILTNDDKRMLKKARDLILSNPSRDFGGLKNFASELGTNTHKLKTGFSEMYGTTVYRFLKCERLRKAKMLVQYGDESFKCIAHLCGFKSVSHFSRSFREAFGSPPRTVRKSPHPELPEKGSSDLP